MGSAESVPFNYDSQLLNTTTPKRSVLFTQGEHKGETPVIRNPLARHGLWETISPHDNGGMKTLAECWKRSVERFPDNQCFGTRRYEYIESKSGEKVAVRKQYVWQTYKQADQIVADIAAGLQSLGHKKYDNIGIFSSNRTEWMLSALAMYRQSMRVISLYDTLGAEAVEYICTHAETSTVFVAKDKVKHLLRVLPKMNGSVKHIIQFDINELYGNTAENVADEDRQAATAAGAKLMGFSELAAVGRAQPVFPDLPAPNDLAFIMYTSGTTGNPKGVELMHSNLAASIASITAVVEVLPTDVLLSYLPLAHIFETFVQFAVLAVGGSVGFFQANVKKLVEDIQELEPTLLPGVPRVFQRIYQKVFEGVNTAGGIKKWYFNRAYQYQCEMIRSGQPLDEGYDERVFSAVRAKVGLRRIRIVMTGAAPCPPYLLEFLKVVTRGLVFQGYGLTETSAGSCVSHADDPNAGHIGPPLPCVEVKLVDVPDMEYLSTDRHPRGELCLRGPSVFRGYYKDPKTTAESISPDGWFATGDIARLNPNGTLSIIDRKKNMFKLSQGEYVAAEKIESVYQRSPLVAQIFVYGNSFKSFLVAVVVPAADALVAHFKNEGKWSGPSAPLGSADFCSQFKKWCTENAKLVEETVLASLKQQEAPLKGFEKVQGIIIESEINDMLAGFTEANGCLTPTFKFRRNNIVKRYLQPLKALYTKLGEAPAEGEVWPGEN